MTDEGLAFARESERLGALGISPEELDDLAHAADKTSKAAERTVRDATKAAASAAREVRAVHARYKKALDVYGDEITAAADMIAELRRKKDASLATFDFTRNGLPTVLRTEAKLKATARKIVDTVIRGPTRATAVSFTTYTKMWWCRLAIRCGRCRRLSCRGSALTWWATRSRTWLSCNSTSRGRSGSIRTFGLTPTCRSQGSTTRLRTLSVWSPCNT